MLRRKIFKSLFEIAIRLVDDAVPPEELERFLVDSINRIGVTIKDNSNNLNAQTIQEFQRAYARCVALDLPISKLTVEPETTLPPILSKHELQKWIESLPDDNIVGRNGVIPKSGEYLLRWIDQFPNDPRLQENMELLLRHIEVKRKNSLTLNAPRKSQDEWLEKHAVSTAFCIYARKINDIRFLNAAFKLNDWAYPNHKRIPIGHQLIRYLWALAETEMSSKDLLD